MRGNVRFWERKGKMITASPCQQTALLVTERFDGVELSGGSRWIETEDYTDCGGDAEGEEDRWQSHNGFHASHLGDGEGHSNADNDTDATTTESEHKSFDEEL